MPLVTNAGFRVAVLDGPFRYMFQFLFFTFCSIEHST